MLSSKFIILTNQTCPCCGKEYACIVRKQDYKQNKHNKHCSKSCANKKSHSEETKQKISNTIKSKIDNGECIGFVNNPNVNNRKICTCKCCGKEFKSRITYSKNNILKHEYNYCSDECRIMSDKRGGYKKGSGRGKSGWYKGIYCDSSWELAFVIYYLDHNLNITRCKEKREYIFNNETHVYIPDFVTDDSIIEIKGYSTPQWKAKLEQNPDIKVLYKNDMKFYIDYVIKNYGKDYIELYDNSNPKYDYSNNVTLWIHKYEDNIYYTMIIKPKDIDYYISLGWRRGRGKLYDGYTKIHIKTNNIFTR